MKLNLIIATLLGLFGSILEGKLCAGQFRFHHENILGTSLDLAIRTESQSMALEAQQFALEEIERLSEIFSSYSSSSELSRWLETQNEEIHVSQELLWVFQRAEHWHMLSNGAFSAATSELSALWKNASELGEMPSTEALHQASTRTALSHWKLAPTESTATRLSNARINLNSIAKGYIIDQIGLTLVNAFPAIESCLINIGGDLRNFGQVHTEAIISDPFVGSRNEAIETIILPINSALATSGNYHQGFTIKNKRYSHILDPRSGYPVDHIASSTVIAPTAADADALATIFSVLQAEKSLELVEGLEGVECFLVSQDGTRIESEGWKALRKQLSPSTTTNRLVSNDRQFEVSSPLDWITNFDCIISLELNKISNRRYRRPYVAIWISDADKLPVRTLSLWIQKEKWLPDLKSWYRDDKLRLLYDDTELVKTISSATRPAGRYRVKWDGTDDTGQAVTAGKYFLNIEVTREHGTYQIIRHEIEFPTQASTTDLGGNTEVKGASIEFRRKKTI